MSLHPPVLTPIEDTLEVKRSHWSALLKLFIVKNYVFILNIISPHGKGYRNLSPDSVPTRVSGNISIEFSGIASNPYLFCFPGQIGGHRRVYSQMTKQVVKWSFMLRTTAARHVDHRLFIISQIIFYIHCETT